MPEQSTPLSGMTGAAVDIGDVREGEQGGAAFEPKSCPIESEKIPITTIYRPDLMPDRVEGSIAPVVEYDMTSVPSRFPSRSVTASASSLDREWERFLPTSSST